MYLIVCSVVCEIILSRFFLSQKPESAEGGAPALGPDGEVRSLADHLSSCVFSNNSTF